ncbi:MAG: NAD(P)/FAD-dependent oxidoreductase, partial [Gammaproteobacteria bacterium]|nr:NAD(P)/FAD-dependent oxidoreductase [Gammaproteobacteria bacterium]
MRQKTAIIIGAGPAGLTAAYELLIKTSIQPIIFESDDKVGGIAKTITYQGNRMDVGGHRFFSKSERVNAFWREIGEQTNLLWLQRKRVSRIYFLRQFFPYPIKFNLTTLKQLGLARVWRITCSYLSICLHPIKPEKSLEDFFINRFGRELYQTFFKDYTEKVWGIDCSLISSEWGMQRIKGLSIIKTIAHAVKKFLGFSHNVETSLIDQFLYPQFGPGQFWDEVAKLVQAKGGVIKTNCKVVNLENSGAIICSVDYLQDGVMKNAVADYFFSTMPVRELIAGFKNAVPSYISQVASGLMYRDFITIGLLLRNLKVENNLIPDNWIYVQEADVKLGRIQVFNNWSPDLLKDPNTVWLGLEYFCTKNDAFWMLDDKQLIATAINELIAIGIIEKEMVLDAKVVRVEKAYPAYFGSFSEFAQIKNYTDKITNLFLIGRNGMHRYNHFFFN